MEFFDESSDGSNFVVGFTPNPARDFDVFAKGYVLAANRLAGMLLDSPRFSDYEAYPVVFLYRHAFELSLKHVIYESARLAAFQFREDVDVDLKNSHDLLKLSQAVGAVLAVMFPGDALVTRVVKSVAEVSADWSRLDPKSDGYRYPIGTKGERSTQPHQVANLRSIATRMASLLEELDTIHFGLNIETDRAEELYATVQSLKGFF